MRVPLECPGCRRPLGASPCPGCGAAWRWRDGVLDLGGGDPEGFPSERHGRLLGLEERHFWFPGRRRLLRRLVERVTPRAGRFVDLGCGSAWLLRDLRGRGLTLAAVDGHSAGLDRLSREDPEVLPCRAEASRTPLPTGYFDTAGLFDVLEHGEDAPLLREAARLLRPGGHLVVSVPALPWLYGEFDRRAGHLRRYSRAGLRRVLEESGFLPVFFTAYQCALLPLVALSRLWGRGDWGLPPGWLNSLLRALNLAEAALACRVPLPWGSSWVATARRV